jgi:hypothetical protein
MGLDGLDEREEGRVEAAEEEGGDEADGLTKGLKGFMGRTG